MYNFNIEKILLQRALRNTRSFSPVDNYFKQLEVIEDLYFEIEKNIESSKLIQQARKQLVISLVSALEVYFKDSLMTAYDSGSFNDSYLVKRLQKRFLLKDIQDIIKNKITIGEVLASIFTFSNLKAVNKIFSSLIGKNFFKELNEYQFELKSQADEESDIPTINKTTMLNEDRRVYFNLKELYSIRPFITHDQPEKSSISEFQVQYFISSAELFAIVIDNYLCSLMNNEIDTL
ncbi:MAG: hypothetical protein A2015_10450 [Spirochaetes bacterium GWF1_31_7]|nr:MAG: hypothetical protein A2Y30_16190 [Spirochaetes bacterium GWE1_32_154]OHD48519.1 MAG: hypothetical protein A2Y29_14165 [Spirochaetes bacterium GWE2_31_10]OHD51433.1 MAG: hypothetical protein A2015_10450 [Spirochaetes bacterium GWF1_31_7]HBD93352.1 hypothetical protein [Spirochaetia bacterium]HBI36683.1 hypothetical protein [Spirochaetia bacterium]